MGVKKLGVKTKTTAKHSATRKHKYNTRAAAQRLQVAPILKPIPFATAAMTIVDLATLDPDEPLPSVELNADNYVDTRSYEQRCLAAKALVWSNTREKINQICQDKQLKYHKQSTTHHKSRLQRTPTPSKQKLVLVTPLQQSLSVTKSTGKKVTMESM